MKQLLRLHLWCSVPSSIDGVKHHNADCLASPWRDSERPLSVTPVDRFGPQPAVAENVSHQFSGLQQVDILIAAAGRNETDEYARDVRTDGEPVRHSSFRHRRVGRLLDCSILFPAACTTLSPRHTRRHHAMFTAEFLLTSLIVVLVPGTGVIFTASTSLAHAVRGAVIESPRVQTWLRRGFAAVFAGLGARLALSDR